MSQKPQIVLLSVGLMTMSACDDPFVFAAGGELTGRVEATPQRWQFDEKSALAQLETRPEAPYSVNFSYVQLDGRLYAYAGDTRTNWVEHIDHDPRVRVRVKGTIYPARAVRVVSDEELAEFAEVWAVLSSFQRDPMRFKEVWLYRLEQR